MSPPSHVSIYFLKFSVVAQPTINETAMQKAIARQECLWMEVIISLAPVILLARPNGFSQWCKGVQAPRLRIRTKL